MSKSEAKVVMFDNCDPEMQRAYQQARQTFRYFWREMAWERRRIVPALDLACVKAPFSDAVRPADARADSENPEVEHMWLDEVDFDGRFVSGVLLNAPNWLKSVKQGDHARIALAEISDWMYAIEGEVYGAYTVNLLRSRMGKRELKEHDDAWGLNFGDPRKIRLVPEQKPGGLLKGWFSSRGSAEIEEHPMSENMAPSLKQQLRKDPAMVCSTDDRGWTFLHQLALAGSLAGVHVLLDQGADVNATAKDGATPLQLATALGWDKVIALLVSKGAK